jgi:predicted alpha/beta superfamily hydrolase
MPQVQKWLNGRLLPGRYGIGGSSLGGLISCYAAYTRPEIYDRSICMSSSFWWNNEDFLNTILKSKTDEKLYLDSGDSGTSQDSKN